MYGATVKILEPV